MSSLTTTAKSDLLRQQDIRDAYRLIGECCDLGSDPAMWHDRMLEGLGRITGAPEAVGGEERWGRDARSVDVVSAYHCGSEAYLPAGGPADDPIFRSLLRRPGQVVTRTRRQLVSDREWYRSESFEYRRQNHVDHHVTSEYRISEDGAASMITLERALGERDFSEREQRLLHFFHAELGPLIGGSLVSQTEPGPERLPTLLRQTLACLLEGDSDNQIAARLGVSHATIRDCVAALYRRFGVAGRAQLFGHAMKRLTRGRWRITPEPPTASDVAGGAEL